MVCQRCSGRMYEEKFIVAGNVVTDLACHLCGNRDSDEIRKNRAEVIPIADVETKRGRPRGRCGAYKRGSQSLSETS